MGLIFWVDSNSLASDLVEKIFRKKEMEIYTLEKIEDLSFLVEDLRPELIVLERETARQNIESLQSQLQKSALLREKPFVILGSQEGLEVLPRILGEIKLPYDPFELPQKLTQIQSQH